MAKIVAPVTAAIAVIGKLKQSSYQPGTFYRSVLFVDISQPEGSESAKIWKSLNDSECQGLTVGSRVQLVPTGQDQNGKAKHNILLADAPASSEAVESADRAFARRLDLTDSKPPLPKLGWTPEQKQAIADKVQQHAALLRFCLETAQRQFGDIIEPADIRALATTLFISATKP